MKQDLMTIGMAAAESRLSAKMIRYYENEGALKPAARSESGYRLYNDNNLQTLHFIRQARTLGFSLEKIKALIALWNDKARSSAEVKLLAQRHIKELEGKATELQAMASSLRHLAEHCHGDHRPDCPILDGLSQEKQGIN